MIEGRLSIHAVRATILSDFQEQGPLGAEMHVRLVQAASGHGDQTLVRIAAPANQWETLLRWLRKEATLPPGSPAAARRKAAMFLRAAATIERLMDVVGRHPGYRGLGMLGTHPEVLVAYRLGDEGRWWPSARQARANGDWKGELRQVNLEPEVTTRSGQVLTVWVPIPT